MPQGQIQIGNEKTATKKVYFEGSDVLRAGYAVCYNADRGTAASDDPLRAYRVEQPTAANFKHFAGIVTEKSDGVQGPTTIEIYVPEARGQKILVWSGAANVIDVTQLRLKNASFELDTDGEGPVVALAMQTVDRSSTSGTAQALMFPAAANPLNADEPVAQFDALSRTAAQLPTAAIWNNFTPDDYLLNTDFRRGESLPQVLVDTAMLAEMRRGTGGIGEFALFTTTDNLAAEAVWQSPVIVSGGRPWAAEFRVKTSTVANDEAGWCVGLIAQDKPTGDLIADTEAIVDGGFIGWQHKEGDGDILDLVYDAASQTQNEHDDDHVTLAADTYVTLGLYFNGTTITPYVNGVATGSVISAADIAAADFPAGVVMNFAFFQKSDTGAADVTSFLDWVRVAQNRAAV